MYLPAQNTHSQQRSTPMLKKKKDDILLHALCMKCSFLVIDIKDVFTVSGCTLWKIVEIL